MLAFRDAWEDATTDAAFVRLDRLLAGSTAARGVAAVERATEALIEAGALEAALVDGFSPVRDEDRSDIAQLRRAGDAVGRLFRAAATGEVVEGAALEARMLWQSAATLSWPAEIRLKAAEGFAWYALHPEGFLASAARLAEALRPGRTVVVGLRGIGAPLASVVAAELAARGSEVETLTVRPRGHPFGRTLQFGPVLAARLRARGAAGWTFLVVDEGPGMSGSSLTAAALGLVALGATDGQVVLMPAHHTDGSGFVSETARAAWPRFRRFAAAVPGAARDPAPELECSIDLSGGLWRRALFGGLQVPVAAAFERRKHLDGEGRVWKFAGLGRRGRHAFDLQAAAAEAGFGPPPVAARSGYVATHRIDGRPLRRRQLGAEEIERAIDWLAFVARTRQTGDTADAAPLLDAVRRNAELAGLGPVSDAVERAFAALPPAAAVRVDGRLAPHEWLVGEVRLLKTDAVDHGDDHFLPGPTDPAWDAAGLIEEWALNASRATEAAAVLAARTGDRGLHGRLPPYRAAYAAVRLGVATLAGPGASGPDATGLRLEARRWRGRLATALARLDGNRTLAERGSPLT